MTFDTKAITHALSNIGIDLVGNNSDTDDIDIMAKKMKKLSDTEKELKEKLEAVQKEQLDLIIEHTGREAFDKASGKY